MELSAVFKTILVIFIFGSAVFVIFLLILKIAALLVYHIQKRKRSYKTTVGFFHPYCNAGGGGERVLWCAVRSIQKAYPSSQCVVYTGDIESSADEILSKAKKTFGISLSSKVEFVFLHHRVWVEAKRYPVITLLGQSLGSMVLGLEALMRYPPDIFFDTMGYAFTYPIFKYLGGCATGCYVHYPTISTDMLAVVGNQHQSFNNRPIIAKSRLLTSIKFNYYRAFAYIYGLSGKCSNVVMVNSSWTLGHIKELWNHEKIYRIFPPCDIRGFLDLPMDERNNLSTNLILSIGQFRPEKNHSLQVEAFHAFLSSLDESQKSRYQMVLAGGCRNEGDLKRVTALKTLIEKLKISNYVLIKTNISYEELKDLLRRAIVGIHTMANEHFGIGVVEFQAAGVIALAHNSGGPKMDIIEKTNGEEKTGFLADSIQAYSSALHDIFGLTEEKRMKIALNARNSCKRFSEENFESDFLSAVSRIIKPSKKEQ